ncbi:MAG: YfhO family protein [Planctomycetales bacterium]|nr:YfhO family protein [Planctomycetales bacterium]
MNARARPTLAAAAGVVILVLAAHADVVVGGRTFLVTEFGPWTDPDGRGVAGYRGPRAGRPEVLDSPAASRILDPSIAAIHRAYRDGRLPLWSGGNGLGFPLLGDPASPALFPLNLPAFLGPSAWVCDLSYLARLAVAGMLALLLGRRLGLAPLPSFAAGAAYALSGHMLGFVQHPFLNAAALLPGLLIAADCLATAPGLRPVAIAGLSAALVILGGFPQAVFLALLTAVAYVAWRARGTGRAGRVLAATLGAGALAAALSAPFALPAAEVIRHSDHTHPAGVGEQALPLRSWVDLVAPDARGNPYYRWDETPWTDRLPGSLGPALVTLALAAILGRGLGRPFRFFAWLLAFFALKCFGLPVVNELVALLPGFSRTLFHKYAGAEAALASSLLAASALARLRAEVPGAAVRGIVPAASILLGALAAFVASVQGPIAPPGRLARVLAEVAPAAGVCAALLVLALARRRGLLAPAIAASLAALLVLGDAVRLAPGGRTARADPWEAPPYLAELVRLVEERGPCRVLGRGDILRSNVPIGFGLEEPASFRPLHPERTMTLLRQLGSPRRAWADSGELPEPAHPLWNLVGLRFVAMREGAPPVAPRPAAAAEVVPGNVPAGELVRGRVLSQTFLCRAAGLDRVEVLLATYARRNEGTLRFRLEELDTAGDARPVADEVVDLAGIADNAWRVFRVPKRRDSAGRRFRFLLDSPDGVPGNAVTVWRSVRDVYAGGEACDGDAPLGADIGFRAWATPGGTDFVLARAGEVSIWENLAALPRAWVVPSAEVIRSGAEALRRMSAPDFDPRRVVFLEEPGAPGERLEGPPGGTVSLTSRRDDRLRLVVETPGPAWLVVAEIHFPGWRARLDGQPVPIRRADYLLRAVAVPGGLHRVEMVYAPATFDLGLALAALGALATLVALALGRRAT